MASTYDGFGRKLTETSNGKINKYSYDLNSNVTNYQLLNGATIENNVTYTYDNMNLLTSTDFNGIIASYTYDENGNMLTKTGGRQRDGSVVSKQGGRQRDGSVVSKQQIKIGQ